MTDHDFMKEAYKEALAAGRRGECPVGAVLVKDGAIIARAGNEELASKDPTAHAEMLCLRRAGKKVGSHVFGDCTMYTTLWPCPMCQGALLQAQIPKVVAGAKAMNFVFEVRFNSANLDLVGPIMEDDCRKLFLDWAKRNGRQEILDLEKSE